VATRDHKKIKKAVEAERQKTPIRDNPLFSALIRSKIGSPAMVFTPEGQEAFWLVPMLVGDSACGFARVERSHKVSQIGIFGSGPEDRSSWIQASFFERPPSETLDAIRARYSGLTLSEPVLSYDQIPAKWAWRIEIADRVKTTVLITPGGWYEQVAKGDMDREG
jgi:hypothetical protein